MRTAPPIDFQERQPTTDLPPSPQECPECTPRVRAPGACPECDTSACPARVRAQIHLMLARIRALGPIPEKTGLYAVLRFMLCGSLRRIRRGGPCEAQQAKIKQINEVAQLCNLRVCPSFSVWGSFLPIRAYSAP